MLLILSATNSRLFSKLSGWTKKISHHQVQALQLPHPNLSSEEIPLLSPMMTLLTTLLQCGMDWLLSRKVKYFHLFMLVLLLRLRRASSGYYWARREFSRVHGNSLLSQLSPHLINSLGNAKLCPCWIKPFGLAVVYKYHYVT